MPAIAPTPCQELTDFCETTYGVPAMEARILIGAYLPTRYPPMWILVQAEQNRFLNDLAYCTRRLWANDITDTWHFRGERPRVHNRLIMLALSEQETHTRIFADRFWDYPGPPIWKTSRYPLLAQRCVRARFTLDPSRFPDEMVRDRLLERITAAYKAAPIDRAGVIPVAPTEEMERRAMLLPMLDKFLKDRTTLMRNLCFVPANHAAISGRTEIQKVDLQAQAAVMKACVPLWMERIIQSLLANEPYAVSVGTVISETRIAARQWPFRLAEKLLQELWANGLLDKNAKGRFRIRSEYIGDLNHLLAGQV